MSTFLGIPRRGACVAAVLFVSALASLAVEPTRDLYRARVHATGQEEPARSRGFAVGLADVLVKLTGDPALAHDPAIATLGASAASLVRDYSHRDLMAGIPVHDEQGTRQRPFVLTIDFDQAKVDAAVRSLGREVWAAARPRLAMFIEVDYGTAHYVLAVDGSRGRDQREALQAAAWRFGMPIVLPSEAAITAAATPFESVATTDPTRLRQTAKTIGGDLPLVGTLTWTPARLGWTAHWRLAPAAKMYEWSVAGVTFDEAFRSAILGAAQILSGHGTPE